MTSLFRYLNFCIMTVFSAHAMKLEKIPEKKEKPVFLSQQDTHNLRDLAAVIFRVYKKNPESQIQEKFEHLFNIGLYYAALANNNNDFMSKQLLSTMLSEQAQQLQSTKKIFAETIESQAYNLQASPETVFFVPWNNTYSRNIVFSEKSAPKLSSKNNNFIVEHQKKLKEKYEKNIEIAQEHYLYDIIFKKDHQISIINDLYNEEYKRKERHRAFLNKEQKLYDKLIQEAQKGVYEASYLLAFFELCGYTLKKEKNILHYIKNCAQNPQSKTSKSFKFVNVLQNVPQPENKKDFLSLCTILMNNLDSYPELKTQTTQYALTFLDKYGSSELLTTEFFAQCIVLARESWSLRTKIIALIENVCANTTQKLEKVFGNNALPLANLLNHNYTGKNNLIQLLILYGDAQKATEEENFARCINGIIAIFNNSPSQEKISFYNQTRSIIKLLHKKGADLFFLQDTADQYKQYRFYSLTDFKGLTQEEKIIRLQGLEKELINLNEKFTEQHAQRVQECVSIIKQNINSKEIMYFYALLNKHGIPGILNPDDQQYTFFLKKAINLGNVHALLELASITENEDIEKSLDLYMNIVSRKKIIEKVKSKAQQKIDQYKKITPEQDFKKYITIRNFFIRYYMRNNKFDIGLNYCKELFEVACQEKDFNNKKIIRNILLPALFSCVQSTQNNSMVYDKVIKLFLESIMSLMDDPHSKKFEKYARVLEEKIESLSNNSRQGIKSLIKPFYEMLGKKYLACNNIKKAFTLFKKSNNKKQFELISNAILSLSGIQGLETQNVNVSIVEKNISYLEQIIKDQENDMTSEQKHTMGEFYYIIGTHYYINKNNIEKSLFYFDKGCAYDHSLCLYSYAYHYRNKKDILSCARYTLFKKVLIEQEKPPLQDLYVFHELSIYYENADEIRERCYQLLALYGEHHAYTAQALYYFVIGSREKSSELKEQKFNNSLECLKKVFTLCPGFIENEAIISQTVCSLFALSVQSNEKQDQEYAKTMNKYLKESPVKGCFSFDSENNSIEFKK